MDPSKEGCCGTHGQPGMPSAMDIAYDAHYKIEGMIRLMIKKNVFTKEEYEGEMQSLVKEIQEHHAAMQQQMADEQKENKEEKKEE